MLSYSCFLVFAFPIVCAGFSIASSAPPIAAIILLKLVLPKDGVSFTVLVLGFRAEFQNMARDRNQDIVCFGTSCGQFQARGEARKARGETMRGRGEAARSRGRGENMRSRGETVICHRFKASSFVAREVKNLMHSSSMHDMTNMFNSAAQLFLDRCMRPLPLVAGGASGGLAGVVLTVARDFLAGSGSQVLVPPEPEPLAFPSLDFGPALPDSSHIHWSSFLLGLAAGFLLWPLLDLALLARLLLTRGRQGPCDRALSGS